MDLLSVSGPVGPLRPLQLRETPEGPGPLAQCAGPEGQSPHTHTHTHTQVQVEAVCVPVLKLLCAVCVLQRCESLLLKLMVEGCGRLSEVSFSAATVLL